MYDFLNIIGKINKTACWNNLGLQSKQTPATLLEDKIVILLSLVKWYETKGCRIWFDCFLRKVDHHIWRVEFVLVRCDAHGTLDKRLVNSHHNIHLDEHRSTQTIWSSFGLLDKHMRHFPTHIWLFEVFDSEIATETFQHVDYCLQVEIGSNLLTHARFFFCGFLVIWLLLLLLLLLLLFNFFWLNRVCLLVLNWNTMIVCRFYW